MSQGVLSLFPPSWGHIPVQLSTPTAETLGHTHLPRQRAVATAPPVMRWRLKQDFFGLRLKRSLTLSYGRTYQKLTESTCCQAGAKDRGCFTHGKPMALHEVLHPPSDRGRNFSHGSLPPPLSTGLGKIQEKARGQRGTASQHKQARKGGRQMEKFPAQGSEGLLGGIGGCPAAQACSSHVVSDRGWGGISPVFPKAHLGRLRGG